MPQQTDSARRTALRKVDASQAGHKVRVAGRVLSYDAATGLAVLMDGGHGLLVDTVLCLDRGASAWATERLSTIMALGHLERVQTARASAVPAMPANAPRLQMDADLVLRAILVVAAPDLDLALWNAVVDEEDGDGEDEDGSEIVG